jgi:adenosylhomocysteine/aminodeoxyfutalosine nucleosidase
MLMLLAPLEMELQPLTLLYPFGKEISVGFGGYRIVESPESREKGIVLCRTGMGKVHSAATVAALLQKLSGTSFYPSSAVLVGIAGGADKEKVGMVHLADRTEQWDFDIRPFSRSSGTYPDGTGIIETEKALNEYIGKELRRGGIAYYNGTAFTGDRFLARERPLSIFSPGSIDMESAAVMAVLKQSRVPASLIRLISDQKDGEKAKNLRLFLDSRLPRIWEAVIAGALTFSG